jgi:hypothetical protein
MITRHRVEVGGPLDRAAVEVVRLEVHRLARQLGIDVCDERLETEVNRGARAPRQPPRSRAPSSSR